MTQQEITAITDKLKVLLSNADDAEFDRITALRQAVRKWASEGQSGEIPNRDALRSLGVPLPGDEPPAENDEDVTIDDSTQLPEAPAEPAPRVATRPTPPRATLSQAVGTAAASAQPTESDPDDLLQGQYDTAGNLLNLKQYYNARKILDELRSQVRGRLLDEVEQKYRQASIELDKLTTQRVTLAREVEKKKAKNLDAQEQAWNKVLEVNPESEEANAALADLQQKQAEADIQSEINTLLPKAEKAAQSDNLTELNKLYGQVQGWKGREISPTLLAQVNELDERVRDLREKTRDRLGQFSTLLVTGDYFEAYKTGRSLVDRTVPTIVDASGFLGAVGAEVPTGEFFAKARDLYKTSLRSLVPQRLDKAAGEAEASPERAKLTLEEARGKLVDPMLVEADRASLKDLLALVDERLEQVDLRITKFNLAKAKVIQAQKAGVTQTEALDLYVQAQQDYKDYPELEQYIARARDAVAEIVGTQLAGRIAEAEGLMERDKFDEALKVLSDARTEAIHQVPEPKEGSGLAQRIIEVRAMESRVNTAKRTHERFQETVTEFEKQVQLAEKGNQNARNTARMLLDSLSPEYKTRPVVVLGYGKLTELLGDEDNWDAGLQEYSLQNWELAEQNFRKVVKSNNPNRVEAEKKALRAQACRLFALGEQAQTVARWKDAKRYYEQVQGFFQKAGTDETTEPIFQESQRAVQSLAPLAAVDQTVQVQLERARALYNIAQERKNKRGMGRGMVEPIPQYAQAAQILQAVENEKTTLIEEVGNLLGQVQSDWQSAYLDGIHEAASADELAVLLRGMALVTALKDAHLLYEKEEVHTARELEARYLDKEYEMLMQSQEKDWSKIEANRARRLGMFDHAPANLEKEYLDAMRGRIRAEALRLRDENPVAAKSYLKKELSSSRVRQDQQLLKMSFELCWELKEWGDADELAKGLGKNEGAEVWSGLTRAARDFHHGAVAEGNAEMAELRQRFGKHPIFGPVIEEKEHDFRIGTLDQLLTQAKAAALFKNDDGYIQAAKLYAMAYEIKHDDGRVITGLSNVGQSLGPGLTNLCSTASALKIGQTPLEQVIAKADSMWSSLNAIHGVLKGGNPLGLSNELKAKLQTALDNLTPKRERWKTCHELILRARNATQQALREPTVVAVGDGGADDPDDRRGGWDFSTARAILDEARNAGGRDPDLPRLVQDEQDGIDRLQTTATHLRARVAAFMFALRAEDFDAIGMRSDDLLAQWRAAKAQADWDGLNALIQFPYPWYDNRVVADLAEHKKLARERKEDWQTWQRWSSATKVSYDLARAKAKQLAGNEKLENLRTLEIVTQQNQYSLEQIIQLTEEWKRACDAFNAEWSARPETGPLSNKAEAESRRVQATWFDEVYGTKNGFLGRATQIQESAKQERDRLAKDVTRLKSIMSIHIEDYRRKNPKKALPANNLNMLRDAYKKVAVIDPLNEDALRAKKMLDGNH